MDMGSVGGEKNKGSAASASAGGPSSSPWVLHQVGGQCGRFGRCGLGGQPVWKIWGGGPGRPVYEALCEASRASGGASA